MIVVEILAGVLGLTLSIAVISDTRDLWQGFQAFIAPFIVFNGVLGIIKLLDWLLIK